MADAVPPSPTFRRALAVVWLSATVAAVLPLAYHPMKAQDLWWHLAAGERMLDEGSLVRSDPWSFSHTGEPWLNHEWLAQVTLALWARWLGVPRLMYWQLAAVALTYALLFDLLRRKTGQSLASFAATLVAAALARPVFEIRPHLYTLLFLVLVLWLCALRRRRALFFLPLLFLLWVNLHSGVLLGLGLLAVALLARHLGSDGISWRTAAALFAACVVATFANPHGFDALTYPIRYATGASAFGQLVEWRSPFDRYGLRVSGYGAALGVFVGAAAAVAASSRLRQRTPLGALALPTAAAATAMSLVSSRFIPYFGIGLALLLGPVIAAVLPFVGDQRRARLALAAGSCALLGAALAAWRVPWRHGFQALTTLELMPVDVCDFWNANQLQGKVFAYYGFGGYAIWCSDGRMRPYIDGRADTVYDRTTHRRYLRFQDLQPGWQAVPTEVGAEFVLWPTLVTPELPVVSHPQGLLATGAWRLVYRDYAAVLLARADLALPPLRSPPDSPYHSLARGAAEMIAKDYRAAERHLTAAWTADPGLLGACRNLAVVQARLGKAEARKTHRECEELAHEPETAARIERLLARPRTGGGGVHP